MLMIPNEIFNVGSEMKDLGESNISTDRSCTATRRQENEVSCATSPLFPLPIVFNNSSLLLQEIESKRSPLIQECIRWMRHISSFASDIIEELQREHLLSPTVTQKKDFQRKMNHIIERTNRLIQLQHELLSILATFLQSLPQSHGQWHCKNESAEDLALVEGDLHVESMQSPVATKFKGEEEEKIGGNSFAGIISLLLAEFEQKRLVGSADFCAIVGAMPVAFDVPVSKTADTVGTICSLRSRLQQINISVASLRLNPIVSTSYGDALARIDKVIIDLTERISESIHHFHEISTTDNVLRQDWAATSTYMRDKKVTPGVIAMASSIRGVAYTFVSQQPKAGDDVLGSSFALLTLNLALTCLLRGCLSITRLYQALNPSRVRLLQWRRDLTYWILSSKELLRWMVTFSPIISSVEDKALGENPLKDTLLETKETLLRELTVILKYLVTVFFLVTDTSDSLLIVLRSVVPPAQSISEIISNEQKGGDNPPALESLIVALNAFASESDESNPPLIESQTLSPIPVFDRMADILFGLGPTTEHSNLTVDASAVATAWQKVITAKVVDPHSWLTSFILSQDCLLVYALLADFDEGDIADMAARNRELLQRFLSDCLQHRAECTNCSYPPLTAEQIARKESFDQLLKELQS